MAPLEPSLTTTRLGIVTPPTQFRSELPGRGPPSGQPDRKLGVVVSVTVTFSTTAVGGWASLIAGTPPRPATISNRWLLGPSGVLQPPVPPRLSRMRVGVTPVKPLPFSPAVLFVNQPLTSTTRSTDPCRLEKSTLPVDPSFTITRLGMVWPRTKFRFDAFGLDS